MLTPQAHPAYARVWRPIPHGCSPPSARKNPKVMRCMHASSLAIIQQNNPVDGRYMVRGRVAHPEDSVLTVVFRQRPTHHLITTVDGKLLVGPCIVFSVVNCTSNVPSMSFGTCLHACHGGARISFSIASLVRFVNKSGEQQETWHKGHHNTRTGAIVFFLTMTHATEALPPRS